MESNEQFSEQIKEPSSTSLYQVSEQIKEPNGDQVSEQITNVNVDFLSFITVIINSLEKDTTQENRIKLVVEAAKRCLKIDVDAEVIHKRIKN